MRPLTHALVGTAAGIVFAPNTFCLVACIVGSVAPDYIDSFFTRARAGFKRVHKFKWEELYEKQHRTWTHNAFYWIGLFLFVTIGVYFMNHDIRIIDDIQWFLFSELDRKILTVIRYFLGGIVLHILCDFLTPMGVGFLPFLSRIRISIGFFMGRLCCIRTNSLGDKIFGFLVFGVAVAFCLYDRHAAFLNQSW